MIERADAILLRADPVQCSIPAIAWEVLCITLKLAKVFPADRCLALQTSGGKLDLMELHKVKFHIEVILLASMEPGDYLMPDLSLADQHPEQAFLEGDPRRDKYISRSTLDQIVSFINEVKGHVTVRRVTWRRRSPSRSKRLNQDT